MPWQAPSPLCGYWHPHPEAGGVPWVGTWTAVIPHHHVRHSIPPDSMSGTIFVPHRRVRNWVPHTTTSAARSPATSQAKLALVGCSQTWATMASWSSPSCSPHSQNQGGPNPFAQLGKHPRVTHSHEKLLPWWHCCITLPRVPGLGAASTGQPWKLTEMSDSFGGCLSQQGVGNVCGYCSHVLTSSTQINTWEKVIQPLFWDGSPNPTLHVACRFPAGCVLPP